MKIVGKSINRVDGLSKVTGEAIYPQDIYLDGMLYGKTLRSKKPHANIEIDITEAEQLEGVVKILTHKDVIGKNHHGVVLKDHEVFCSKRVRQIGEPLAFVIAETERIAESALEIIRVKYDELEGVFEPEIALQENSPKVHGNTNEISVFKIRKGNVEIAFKNCDIIVEQEYRTPMQDHIFLQPEAGVSYLERDGTIVVMVATQYPHFDREEIAEAMGMPESKIKVLNPAVGGAFGGREDITMQIHLALATKITKKPVKAIYSREESFLAHSKRHPFIMKYKTGASKDGKLIAMEADLIADSGAHASWSINVARKAGVHATGPYEIPNVSVSSKAVYTNNPYTGAMRGFGVTQVAIAHEQQMDLLAEKLNMSPIEFRRRNMFKVNSSTATRQILKESVPMGKCIDEIEKHIKNNPLNIKKHIKRGSGIATTFYGTGYGNGFKDESKVLVELKNDGKIVIYTGATEVGQGAKTVLAQIGAEVFNVTTDYVEVINEDTSITPDSGTAAASRQTYNTGGAVKIAAQKLRRKMIVRAKEKLELDSTEKLIMENGFIAIESDPSRIVSFSEIRNFGEEDLKEEGIFIAKTTKMDKGTGQGDPYWPYSFSACWVEVEVDIRTGEVNITNSSLAQDVGRAINPNLVEGQMDGGYAMGVGFALMEDVNLKNGVMKNKAFSSYLIPTSLDTIDVENIIVEDFETSAPYGAKGVGEPVMIPVAAAILNAIYDAVGARVMCLPATPDKLLKEILSAKIAQKSD
ncbi:MAG: xanthine dehydrogenase [Alkaliphilus sp.]|nr:molybdopterin-dependent oxidoreductase [bacterium AH-315-L21]MBN4069350.1 molybdopterin-dependent oxidoreductase [bacterium AH-315-G05]PHS35907.1 MAG: xanthine dehydrogenase [Alkaliphilus sp.]